MGRSARGEDRIKVHSLGYMQEKLKRNLRNSVERYILTATTFIRKGGSYSVDGKVDDLRKELFELALYSDGIERIINRIDAGMPISQMVSQELAESKRMLNCTESNQYSSFYYHMRSSLVPFIGSVDFQNKVRDIGSLIRETVRQELTYCDEEKVYVRSPEDIDIKNPTVRILALEHRKLRKRLV